MGVSVLRKNHFCSFTLCKQHSHKNAFAYPPDSDCVNRTYDIHIMKQRPLQDTIGYPKDAIDSELDLRHFINIKLAALDQPIFGDGEDNPFLEFCTSLLATAKAKDKLLKNYLCPVDQHIHNYLEGFFNQHGLESPEAWLPTSTFTLERHGLARTLSIPHDVDEFHSDIIESYRVENGVLHNPKADRRTTKGVFHVCEGGLPVADDKKAVPVQAFHGLLKAALQPPKELMRLPYTCTQEEQAEVWVSLLLRPLVVPEVPGVVGRKTMETRFFAPGNMVANLDFVESIFGNAGNPMLPENDARLDIAEWSGHTGCIILAPQMLTLTKKELGLPHVSKATERQKRDSMCWESEDELYNDGTAFKITCRDRSGVVVTLIADNYFGYCKKEVKTQLSYAANLYGLAEEEHAGGALAYPSFDLGEDFQLSQLLRAGDLTHTYGEVIERLADRLDPQPEGYAIDKTYPNILYVPETAAFSLRNLSVTWEQDGKESKLRLSPDNTYLLPSGYKIHLQNPKTGQRWRLTGTRAEGLLCHKPCTVSGGGKSEISKPITDAMLTAPVYTADLMADLDLVEEITKKDFSARFIEPREPGKPSRPMLSGDRSLGSVIRMLTPNPEYTEEYNEWLSTIPNRVRDLVLTIKRFYKPSWGDDWKERFSVATINGTPGVELRYRDRQVIATYVRVGYAEDHSWRLFSLRKDFWPAAKLQREDDITASVVVPADQVDGIDMVANAGSVKFVENCEFRLFQRPDDAILAGYDKHTENDYATGNRLFANYAPLSRADVQEIRDDVIRFDKFTDVMKEAIESYLADSDAPGFMVVNTHPRIVDGTPTKNPRYLQDRPDLGAERAEYIAEIGTRLKRRLENDAPVHTPVGAVLPGRRNNPADEKAGIRPLAVFNPIHYQELPELFMDFVASLTGKSPSTTGAGSEGALTKGPFNMLLPVTDLNNALLNYILTGSDGFTTAAGYVGHKYRMDHDISLLVPELWSRMRPEEQDPEYLIKEGYLESLEDFEYEGKMVPASRLGYRITDKFARDIFGRIFSHPATVLTDEMLKPELQSMPYYVDGIYNIVEAQQKAALRYFEDGGIEQAIPPLKALIHIMAHGEWEGKTLADPEVRALFDRDTVLASDWYQERLKGKVALDIADLKERIAYAEAKPEEVTSLHLEADLDAAKATLAELEKDPVAAAAALVGTLGLDPMVPLG